MYTVISWTVNLLSLF